jgi:L-2-hydroxyglutarate oxidase LhgO
MREGDVQRIGVIGAGILGLAVARRLAEVLDGVEITVLDKETRIGAHQTGHNSGVVHAGLYYPPGSLKARLCRRGASMLKEYCAERGLPYEECGKVVVAVDDSELDGLESIRQRAEANGVPDLRRLDGDGLREIEPHASGVAALHSPRTAITDFVAVAEAYAKDLAARAGGCGWAFEPPGYGSGTARSRSAPSAGPTPRRSASTGWSSAPGCTPTSWRGGPGTTPSRRSCRSAGSTSRCGRARPPRPRADLSRAGPGYPFLGVHFTRRVGGRVDIGPNAVPALAREGYRRRTIVAADVRQTLAWPGFRRLALQHWRMAAAEIAGSLSRSVYLSRARRYVPELRAADVVPAPAGVRAQAVDRDGSLVDDFRIHHRGAVTAVRNAPSPAATSSLAIAEYVVDRIIEQARAPS